jgi:hypothetical protein
MSRGSEKRSAAAGLLSLSLLAAGARAQTSQSWNEVDLAAWWRGISFTVPLVARVDARLPNPQLLAAGLTADLPLPWQMTLTGGYLFVDLPQQVRSEVHVPLVALSKAFRIGRVSLADRNRFEKLIGLGASPVRYRNRLRADLPLDANEQWHAFLDDEVFYDFSASQWTQNRFQVGGGARLNPRLALDLYLLQRNLRGGAPPTRVLGATLRVTLAGKPGAAQDH